MNQYFLSGTNLSYKHTKACKFIVGVVTILYFNIQAGDTERAFTEIYTTAAWGLNDKGEGFSGGGSLFVNARPYIELLEEFITSNNILSVVDAGCGDWEFSKHVKWNNACYKGYDVVKHVIDKNITNYANDKTEFFHGNFIDIELPGADLLICKDVLQHLSNDDVFKFIKQFSKFKYILLTNDVDPQTLTSNNSDIVTGQYRRIDLSESPFELIGEKLLSYKDLSGSVKTVFLIRRQ